jgi:hypothetical protein
VDSSKLSSWSARNRSIQSRLPFISFAWSPAPLALGQSAAIHRQDFGIAGHSGDRVRRQRQSGVGIVWLRVLAEIFGRLPGFLDFRI